jgi:peroxiredoxin
MIKPGTPAPALDLPLIGGGRFRLADQQPGAFTLVVFYRGCHCPICRPYL